MRISGTRLFLLCWAFLSFELQAETLSWEQCVSEASKNNAAVKSAYESWQASSSQINATKSAFLPQVSASFSANYGKNMAIPNSETEDSYNASVQISQNIFNGWADQARVEQSDATAAIA